MTPIYRQQLAYQCLQNIAIGDAFGESFFGDTNTILQYIDNQVLPVTTWEYTDDTIMAIAVYQQLREQGTINQDALALAWAQAHEQDPNRGYGATARRILRGISAGGDWRQWSAEVFDGMGSMGNGAAMRVGPIGAYYYDNSNKTKALARASAQITHAHEEAQVGAMAVALATALATQSSLKKETYAPEAIIQYIVEQLPPSDTTSKINKALSFSANAHPDTLKTVLGNGSKMTSQDTVPFVLWCAAHHWQDFEAALWKAVSVLGDRDTIAAMVAGIVGMSCDPATIPRSWQEQVEGLPV